MWFNSQLLWGQFSLWGFPVNMWFMLQRLSLRYVKKTIEKDSKAKTQQQNMSLK